MLHTSANLYRRLALALGLPALVTLSACSSRIEIICQSTPIVVDGVDTGFAQCGEFVHRAQAVACTNDLPRPTTCSEGFGSCTLDTECAEFPYGYCGGSGFDGGCSCHYGCVEDADCGAGFVCECLGFIGQCVAATCATDADCPVVSGGSHCATADTDACPYTSNVVFACIDPNDECVTHGDCGAGQACVLESDDVRRCKAEEMCGVPGRPFEVRGALRVAPVEVGPSDWRALVAELSDSSRGAPAERAAIAEHWAHVAALEHASIAAFARFALQLLSFGAPADLVARATEAMADEARHARLAYGLASSFAGAELRPGALDVTGALEDSSLHGAVRLALHEACLGETAAAAEVLAAAEACEVPALRDALLQIAEEETRHAELAFSFVRWALQREPSLRGLVRSFALERGESVAADPKDSAVRSGELPVSAAPSEPGPLAWAGVLSPAFARATRARALETVARPLLAALLEQGAPAHRGDPPQRKPISARAARYAPVTSPLAPRIAKVERAGSAAAAPPKP